MFYVFLNKYSTAANINITTNINPHPIHIGDTTHHHDQSILPVNFSITKIKVRIDVIPILDPEFFIVFIFSLFILVHI